METQQILGNRYELLRRIGVGGMASVFLAHDSRLDRDVAVKVLDMAAVTDGSFVERFRREARAAAAINHPNVVSIYDWGEAGKDDRTGQSLYYLVMEYVPGPNLKEKVQREGPLPEADALGIIAQVASALQAAHARGLVHRDIKSQNVLIDASGNAKVADFGIAYLEGLTHLTQTNAVSGTAHYISPEQAQGRRVDARTDIYSLGVVLYELLTGRVPFEGESLVDVALHHVQDEPVPVSRAHPGISAPTAAIVARAMAKDPAQRFTTAADMRIALDGARTALDAQLERTHSSLLSSALGGETLPSATPTRGQATPPASGNTVKLGTGVPGRRPRLRQEEHRSRFWPLAVPVLLLALVGGALAIRSLEHRGTTAAPVSMPPSATIAARSTARAGSAASTATSQRATAPNRAPSATAPRRTPTAAPSTSTLVTVPTVTQVPVSGPPPASRIAVPTATPAPTVVPPAAMSGPTSSSDVSSSPAGASSPDGAVTSFYRLVTQHQYGVAAGLWSNAMKANYPPSSNIYGRFDGTQAMNVRITSVSQSGATAAVGIALAEHKTDGTVQGYVGSWNLVRGTSGWLLDSVNLNPAPVSTEAGTVQSDATDQKPQQKPANSSDG